MIERPIGEDKFMWMVAKTPSIEEAERIAEIYEMKGYKTIIIKEEKAGIKVYEVWVGKKGEGRRMDEIGGKMG